MVISLLYFTGCEKADESNLKTGEVLQSQNEPLVSGAWTRKADMPGVPGVFSGIQFSIDGIVYMGYGGYEASYDYNFWAYNPSTDTWTQKSNLKGGFAYSEMVSFSIGKKGYTATGGQGFQSYAFSDEFVEYDPATNTWTPRASFPGGPRRQATGFSVGNKGYVGAGYLLDREAEEGPTETYYQDMWEYNPASDCWTRKADFPGGSSAAFGLGKYGYMLSGTTFWQYNPASNKWITKAEFPGLSRSNAVGFVVNNKGYVGTGQRYNENTLTFLKDFWEYNPETDQWLQQADFAGDPTSKAFGTGTKTKGYIKVGESDENAAERSDFFEFDPSVSD
ncbi:MAG: type sorting protein [Sphingobacteriales bacterium]|nr:type sorting protein [Sphingobacteriales bacterium]